jgi:signal transduction histidine kinase
MAKGTKTFFSVTQSDQGDAGDAGGSLVRCRCSAHTILTGLIAPVYCGLVRRTGRARRDDFRLCCRVFLLLEPGAGGLHRPVRDYFGVISYVIPCAIFIAFGRAMRQMAAALEAQAVSSLRQTGANQFIAVLSHELRNPLAPLVTDLEIIKMTGRRASSPSLSRG